MQRRSHSLPGRRMPAPPAGCAESSVATITSVTLLRLKRTFVDMLDHRLLGYRNEGFSGETCRFKPGGNNGDGLQRAHRSEMISTNRLIVSSWEAGDSVLQILIAKHRKYENQTERHLCSIQNEDQEVFALLQGDILRPEHRRRSYKQRSARIRGSAAVRPSKMGVRTAVLWRSNA